LALGNFLLLKEEQPQDVADKEDWRKEFTLD
jgi:hypothetical protein